MDAATSPIDELAEVARAARKFRMRAELDLTPRKRLKTSVSSYSINGTPHWRLSMDEETERGSVGKVVNVADVVDAMRQVASSYPKATLLPDTIRLTIEKGPTTASKLKSVVVRAWHEVLGRPIPTTSELADQGKVRKAARKAAEGGLVDLLKAEESVEPPPADLAGLLDRLKGSTDPPKLDKAMEMLKADRFRLFAEVAEGHLVGVVRSQSDPALVYACRLAADGQYACCTQNLNVCGGLRGSPCKHLLVLIVGLAQAGRVDPGSVHAWTRSSRGRKPRLDKDAMAEVFLRYKGAEAGEVDWRPTETIPEDFYAM